MKISQKYLHPQKLCKQLLKANLRKRPHYSDTPRTHVFAPAEQPVRIVHRENQNLSLAGPHRKVDQPAALPAENELKRHDQLL